jgi:preprotein translocase subunit SecG
MVLTVVLMIIAVCLIFIVLLQNNRAAGLGAMGGNNGDSYWSKNKGNSIEGALSRYTKIGGALFMIVAAVIMFVS